MKDKSKAATARPWIYKHDNHGTRISPKWGQFKLASLESCGDEEREANAALIVQAVNEHAALNAVAEAAKLNDSCWMIGEWRGNDRLAPIEARRELHNTLANLDAVRKAQS